jgi:predicted dehydrogenase
MKRRDFIEKAVAGTAGITISASILPLTSSCKGANDKVVLAIIGAGARGRGTIISTCKVNSNVEIKTVCDVNDLPAALTISTIEKELGYKPKHIKNMKEVFNDRDIDAVWISTPDHWHALATVWACQARKDVYVEKTPDNCIWEGRKMIEAAKKYRRIVQIGFQNRSAPYALSAREYIKSGKLGQVVHIKVYNLLGGGKWMPQPDSEVPQGLDWDAWLGPAPDRPYNPGIINGWGNYWAYNVGTLNDASHQLDLIRMVMGDPGHPKSIYGWGGNKVWGSQRETPEFQSFTLDFEKFTVTCESGNATNYMKKTPENIRFDPTLFPDWKTNADRIEIYGTEGLMYLGRQGGGWQVMGADSKILAQEGGIHPDKYHQVNFIESIKTRNKPNADVEQGHLSAALVHFGNIAYRTGNKQLNFDAVNERFIDNDDANKLLKVSYREKYKVPEKV